MRRAGGRAAPSLLQGSDETTIKKSFYPYFGKDPQSLSKKGFNIGYRSSDKKYKKIKNEQWVFYSLSYPGSLDHKPTSHSWLCAI